MTVNKEKLRVVELQQPASMISFSSTPEEKNSFDEFVMDTTASETVTGEDINLKESDHESFLEKATIEEQEENANYRKELPVPDDITVNVIPTIVTTEGLEDTDFSCPFPFPSHYRSGIELGLIKLQKMTPLTFSKFLTMHSLRDTCTLLEILSK